MFLCCKADPLGDDIQWCTLGAVIRVSGVEYHNKKRHKHLLSWSTFGQVRMLPLVHQPPVHRTASELPELRETLPFSHLYHTMP